jgi:hypothetical protein
VTSQRQVWSMAACLLSRQREQPAIGLASGGGADALALSVGDVRAVVGPLPRIYLLSDERLLAVLAGLVGRSFALLAGTARVWWPELALADDPEAHPLFIPLIDEGARSVREFARVFDLSRPVVRDEIADIEAARRLAEDQLRQVRSASRQMYEPPPADLSASASVDQHGREPSRRLRAAAARVVDDRTHPRGVAEPGDAAA